MADLYAYANTVKLRMHGNEDRVVGTFSRHWAAYTAIIRHNHPEFRPLGHSDKPEDLDEELLMRARITKVENAI
jgi:hypothetical protein